MKKLALILLCALLMTTSVGALAAGSAPKVSFDGKSAQLTGGFDYTLTLRASAAFAQDTQVALTCEETKETYTVTFPAGASKASIEIPTERVTKRTAWTFTIGKGEGYAADGGKLNLKLIPVPRIEFYMDASYGYVGHDMSVIVTCKIPSYVIGSHTFQLRDQTGRLYQEKEWKNPENRLVFKFPVTADMEGGKYFSVWWNGIRVSEINAGYGAITDASRSVIRTVETTDPYMSITLDCCYDDHQTDEILAILDEYNVKATFFMAGYFLDNFPESAKKIAAAGHEIGNHTDTHPPMPDQSAKRQITQILKPIQKAEELLGVRMRLYRPPFGDHSQAVTALARGEGMEVVMWTIDSHDWDENYKHTPDKIIKRDKNKVGPGTIVLHHLDGYNTPDVLRQIIPYYQNELGLTLVPVSELMSHGGRTVPELRQPDTLTELTDDML